MAIERFFLFDIHRFILININRNTGQKSWEHILRTFILQASCAQDLSFISSAPRSFYRSIKRCISRALSPTTTNLPRDIKVFGREMGMCEWKNEAGRTKRKTRHRKDHAFVSGTSPHLYRLVLLIAEHYSLTSI